MDLTKVRLMKPTSPLRNCKLYGVATKCLHDIPIDKTSHLESRGPVLGGGGGGGGGGGYSVHPPPPPPAFCPH